MIPASWQQIFGWVSPRDVAMDKPSLNKWGAALHARLLEADKPPINGLRKEVERRARCSRFSSEPGDRCRCSNQQDLGQCFACWALSTSSRDFTSELYAVFENVLIDANGGHKRTEIGEGSEAARKPRRASQLDFDSWLSFCIRVLVLRQQKKTQYPELSNYLAELTGTTIPDLSPETNSADLSPDQVRLLELGHLREILQSNLQGMLKKTEGTKPSKEARSDSESAKGQASLPVGSDSELQQISQTNHLIASQLSRMPGVKEVSVHEEVKRTHSSERMSVEGSPRDPDSSSGSRTLTVTDKERTVTERTVTYRVIFTVLALVLAGGTAWFLLGRDRGDKKKFDIDIGVKSFPDPQSRTYANNIRAASRNLRLGKLRAARKYLELCLPKHSRGFEWHYLDTILRRSRLFQGSHKSIIRWLTVSPDGKRLASASFDRTIKIWDVETGRELAELAGHKKQVSSVLYYYSKRDNQLQLVSGGYDGTVRIWNLKSGRNIRTLEGPRDRVTSIAVALRGRLIASGDDGSDIVLWQPASGKKRVLSNLHTQPVHAVVVLPTPQENLLRFASADKGGNVVIWTLPQNDPMGAAPTVLGKIAPDGDMEAYAMAIAPRTGQLAVGYKHSDDSGSVRLFKLEKPTAGSIHKVLSEHPVFALAFSPYEETLAIGHRTQPISIWKTSSLGMAGNKTSVSMAWPITSPTPQLRTFSYALAYLPGKQKGATRSLVAAGTIQGTARYGILRWDPDTMNFLPGHAGRKVMGAAISQRGDVVASIDTGGWLLISHPGSHTKSQLTRPHDRGDAVALDASGRFLATAGTSKGNRVRIQIFEISKSLAKLRCTLEPTQKRRVNSLVWLPPLGKKLVLLSGGYDRTLTRWTLQMTASGCELDTRSPATASAWIWDIAYRKKDGVVAFSDHHGVIYSLSESDLAKESPRAKRFQAGSAGGGRIHALSFQGTGSRLVAGGSGGHLSLWSYSAKGRPKRIALASSTRSASERSTHLVLSVAYSGDGRTIASGGENGAVRLWNGDTLDHYFNMVPTRKAKMITSVSFADRHRVLLFTGAKGMVGIVNTRR